MTLVNFEHISHLVLVFLLLNLFGWVGLSGIDFVQINYEYQIHKQHAHIILTTLPT